MNYETIKNEFIKLKKEELEYIYYVSKESYERRLSEYEKLMIYRKLNDYKIKLNDTLKKLRHELLKTSKIPIEKLKDIFIEFDLDKDYLSYMDLESGYLESDLSYYLWIDPKDLKFKLTYKRLLYGYYYGIDLDKIQNKQRLIEDTIYVFKGYYDPSEDNFIYNSKSMYGLYEDIRSNLYAEPIQIYKTKMKNFEKDKTIIYSKRYVQSSDIKRIFEEEILNDKNKSLNDCVVETRKRIEELNYKKSPEYKERVLLNKINELYEKVKGKCIQEEILYSGSFLEILRETYKLPNKKIVKKEKIIKNGGKDSVIIIAITQDKEYIITFQNRIKDVKIAEFPAGYIENNEDVINAAKRELKEETGYDTNDLFILDKSFTAPGIDNSTTYVVVANNCVKTNDVKNSGSEFVSYGLFSEKELKYLINNNIMSGSRNKLAYYNLVNNVDDCNIISDNGNKKIYKKKKEIKIEL